MSPEPFIAYIDRRTGQVRCETVYAGRMLYWCYNNRFGIWLTRVVLSHPFISALYGWYHRRSISRRKIAPFVQRMGIDMADFAQPVSAYRCFNDFFVRVPLKDRRPIDRRPGRCISPVDGKLLAFPHVGMGQPVQIKRHLFDLRTLLRDDTLASKYNGGSLLVCRLHLSDYHHVHFPDSGVPHKPHIINGSLYAGGPYALRHIVPFYTQNVRTYTEFDSDHFGQMLVIEVGAFTVGSIRSAFRPGERVAVGDHKGWFELGGSTVVLLFEPGRVTFDSDILSNSVQQIETYVHMGESIGCANGGRE